MDSSIGRYFCSPRARRFAVVVGLVTVAADMVLVAYRSGYDTRLVLALVAFVAILYLTEGDLDSVGLRLVPKQGWRPWFRLSARIGLAVAICVVVGFGIWRLTGHEVSVPVIPPTHIVRRFLHMCFVAPVMEETVYRLVLCVALVNVLGAWRSIAVSGLLFGLLHVLYGNPSPENLVGGLFLGWAYLKSDSILLPVMLHSVGNAIVLAYQIGVWYVIQ